MSFARHARLGEVHTPAPPSGDGPPAKVIDLRDRSPMPRVVGDRQVGGPPVREGRHRHRRVRRPSRRAALLAVVGVASTLVAVVTAVVLASGGGAGPGSGPASVGSATANEATRWLAANTLPGTRLLVPPDLRDALRRALPDRHVVGYAAADADADVVVVARGLTAARYPRAFALASRARPVASVGELSVRELGSTDIARERDAVLRRLAGEGLARNAALDLTPQTATAFRDGDVDARLLMLLAGLADAHRLSVEVVPDRAAAGADVLIRTAWISVVDGTAVRTDPSAAAQVMIFVRAQGGPLRPVFAGVTHPRGVAVLVVRFPVPSPVGLLALPELPTSSPSPQSG